MKHVDTMVTMDKTGIWYSMIYKNENTLSCRSILQDSEYNVHLDKDIPGVFSYYFFEGNYEVMSHMSYMRNPEYVTMIEDMSEKCIKIIKSLELIHEI